MKKDVCKFFNGVYGPGMEPKKCDADIDYRSLVGGDDTGWVIRTPCFKRHNTRIVCNSMELPTDDEVEESERSEKEWMEKTLVVVNLLPGLKKKHPQGGNGIIDCPICSGKIGYSVSSLNLHVHLRCNTEGCVFIME